MTNADIQQNLCSVLSDLRGDGTGDSSFASTSEPDPEDNDNWGITPIRTPRGELIADHRGG